MNPSRLSVSLLSLLTAGALSGATVNVNVAQPGAPLNPAMWGVFFEDINFGADGGLGCVSRASSPGSAARHAT